MSKRNIYRVLIVSFAVVVFAVISFPGIMPLFFKGKENYNKKDTVVSSTQKSLNETAVVESMVQNAFIKSVPITFHVDKYKEFQIIDGDVSGLKVSPDGQNILFIIKKNGVNRLGILNVIDGKAETIDLPFNDYADPSWNADGAKIVFAGMKNGIWEIYLFVCEDKKLLQVTTDPGRKKSWPRVSPYKFDGHYRIAYVSEENKRKDIWWVRESGQWDMPITQRDSVFVSSSYWDSLMPPPIAITEGGDRPVWSPSGNLLLYHMRKGYAVLKYNYESWWGSCKIPVPSTASILEWSPNQIAFLLFDPHRGTSTVIPRNSSGRNVVAVNELARAISYFPDGKGFAYSTHRGSQSIIAIQPFDDPLGDVSNLWMYSYTTSQKTKMQQNQLLFLNNNYDQIYNLFESERYDCGNVDQNSHARPYFVTSDAVLETFYAAFAALYGAIEHSVLAATLQEFSREGMAYAVEKKFSKDVITFFEIGLALLRPENRATISPEAKGEIIRIEGAKGETGQEISLFRKKLEYGDFFIRGKYERDTMMQGYFRAIKWYQAFTLDLDSAKDREDIAAIIDVANSPKVLPSLKKIFSSYRDMVGESRYYNPLNLKAIDAKGIIPPIKSGLPWIESVHYFRLLPSIYTLDAYIFDNLIFHPDSPNTVEDRMLPKGLDVMAGLGSDEAYKILISELEESRYKNYENRLQIVRDKIKRFPQSAWSANLYQNWLYALESLVKEPPAGSPSFAKTSAWKRKQLNSSLGSWVNLRYETIAVVEQVSAECGEGGYERLNIGMPKGYVEPNPEFFHRLDEGFSKIGTLMELAISNTALRTAAQTRVLEYRKQIQSLETMARKELAGQDLSDEEYFQILDIGGVIEHFILIMGSLNGKDNDHAVRHPDPIRKIVDVQKDYINGIKLYEALGYANEINVAVPFYGRRQIAKGPIYSYYEFTSAQNLSSKEWREIKNQPHPSWIAGLYEGSENSSLYSNSDF